MWELETLDDPMSASTVQGELPLLIIMFIQFPFECIVSLENKLAHNNNCMTEYYESECLILCLGRHYDNYHMHEKINIQVVILYVHT